MSIDKGKQVKTTRKRTREEQQTRWVDWSQYKQDPERFHDELIHEKKINYLIGEENVTRDEAVWMLRFGDVKIPAEEVRHR